MKNILMMLTILLGGTLTFPLAQSDEWPYYQPGFDLADEEYEEYEDYDESDDGFPPEDELMPGMSGGARYDFGFDQDNDEDNEDFDDGDDESDESSMSGYDDE